MCRLETDSRVSLHSKSSDQVGKSKSRKMRWKLQTYYRKLANKGPNTRLSNLNDNEASFTHLRWTDTDAVVESIRKKIICNLKSEWAPNTGRKLNVQCNRNGRKMEHSISCTTSMFPHKIDSSLSYCLLKEHWPPNKLNWLTTAQPIQFDRTVFIAHQRKLIFTRAKQQQRATNTKLSDRTHSIDWESEWRAKLWSLQCKSMIAIIQPIILWMDEVSTKEIVFETWNSYGAAGLFLYR